MSAESSPADEYPVEAGGPPTPPREPLLGNLEEIEAKAVERKTEPVEGYQFTLAELFVLFAVAAVFFSLVSLLGRTAEAFAGVMGLSVLVGLALCEFLGVRRAIVRFAWWAALLTYLVTCVATLVLA
jgi:hypothetical protein